MKSRMFNEKELFVLKWILSNAPHGKQEDDFFSKIEKFYFVDIESEFEALRQKTWCDRNYFPSEKLLAIKCFLNYNISGFRRAFRNIQGQMIDPGVGNTPT